MRSTTSDVRRLRDRFKFVSAEPDNIGIDSKQLSDMRRFCKDPNSSSPHPHPPPPPPPPPDPPPPSPPPPPPPPLPLHASPPAFMSSNVNDSPLAPFTNPPTRAPAKTGAGPPRAEILLFPSDSVSNEERWNMLWGTCSISLPRASSCRRPCRESSSGGSWASSGVSICTFVLVKKVKLAQALQGVELRRELGSEEYLYFCTSKASVFVCVSICTFVLVKQVNCVPR
jgi:hypothetical protein